MKKKTALFTTVAALSALLLTACPGQTTDNYFVTGDYLTGKAAKRVYNAYMGAAPKNFDARSSQTGDVIMHVANFEDCLLMNDEYGILKKSLAATAHRNGDDTKFWFTIRKDQPWVTCENKIYVDPSTKQEQYVKAEDFVTTAKEILNYSNRSEIYYMYTLFIKNAWEYYCYTMMSEYISGKKIVDGFNYGDEAFYNSDDAQAAQLAVLVKKYSNENPETPITGSDLEDIAAFNRIGISVDAGVLTYELNQPAPFFPTMLTYTPYTPMNKAFIKEQKDQYGKKRENILYCGPYICKSQSGSALSYEKNQHYWNKGKVHIDTVNFYVPNSNLGYADQRKAYNEGTVDGFSLNVKDDFGWKEYITGYDGKGDIQHPVSDLVNSRELDDVDYTYHFVLNPNRSLEDVSFADSNYYKSEFDTKTDEGKAAIRADITNTNKALQLTEVRKLILNGIDLESYNKYYYAPERDQYQMNTFTPRGYVYDGAGVDYVDYYYAYFAEQKGLVDPDEEDFNVKVEAGKAAVGPQQITGVNLTNNPEILEQYPWLNANEQVTRAKRSVQLYNEEHASDPISLPINIEFLGVGALDDDSAAREEEAVNLWNERANGCTLSKERSQITGLDQCTSTDGQGRIIYPTFYLRLSNAKDQDTLSNQAENGYYTIYTGWGWMGDYADPLTYVHCYATNGEMSKMCGNTTLEQLTYDYDPDFDSLEEKLMYGTGEKDDPGYNTAVKKANGERTTLKARYQAFAEVEYRLLNELYIMRPVAMHTQGWAASVSKAAGYENPQAHYGLADHILLGMWVLVEPPTGAERKEARDLHKRREAEALEAVGGNAINGAFVD